MRWLLGLLLCVPAFAACGAGYSWCIPVTQDHTKVSASDQTNFTVLFSQTNTAIKTVANSGHVQNTATVLGQTVPADLIFSSTTNCGTPMSWEVEKYVPTTGQIIAHVFYPTVSASVDTVITMCYGKASVTTFQGGALGAAWDPLYQQVLHVPDGTTLSLKDSSANGFDPTGTGTPTAGTGQIGGAMALNGVTQNINTSANIIQNNTDNFTVSAWANPTTISVGTHNIFASGTSLAVYSIQVRRSGATMDFFMHSAGSDLQATFSNAVAAGTWTLVAATWDGANMKLYTNGVLRSTVAAASRDQAAAASSWGNALWDGLLDEMKVYKGARSVSFLLTEFNNQNAPSTFITLGSEQAGSNPPTVPVFFFSL